MDVTIRLDVSRHCIETATRHRYNRCLSAMLRSGDRTKRAEAELDLLKCALETLDFPFLRANYRELSGGGESPVALSRDAEGTVAVWIDGKPI